MRRIALALIAAAAVTSADAETGLKVATFAGGCFWSMETDFDKVVGVTQTTSGYAGGHTPNPTYAEVGTGRSGHVESLQVTYDPKVVSYAQLLDYYWHHVDIFDGEGQFCDKGDEYRPVVFVATPEEKAAAIAGKEKLEKTFNKPVAVRILDAAPFTAAEVEHQDFHVKHPDYYARYRVGCRRDARIKEIWGQEQAAVATH
jgi:peptide-methionine (S)-S-oxide reductase